MAGTNRRLTYTVGVEVDTKNLTTQINAAMQALQKLSTSPLANLKTQFSEASRAAQELNISLRSAINQETGKFDLLAFRQSLQLSGKDIGVYAQQLSNAGAIGKEAFNQVARVITQAELPLRRSGKLLDSLWTTMKNTMRWQLTSTVLNTFIGGIKTAYGYTKDLNESLNGIQIVTGKNSEEMAKFAKQANEAAKALSTTTTKYTEGSLTYFQQGLSDKDVQARTDTTIKYANVADISTETAAEQLTAIWNNFDDGSKSLEYYVDVMTKLGAETASSSSEISEGLQKFAAVADTVGLSYEYAASALATITATTRESADTVGTALRTLFARIQGLKQGETQDDGTTLNKYSKALANVGIQIKDTTGEIKNMDQILEELGARWTTLAKDEQLALAQTVAGVRQYGQLIALMDNWDFFKEILATAYGSGGTLEEQAKIYADSWQAARDRVRASAEDIYDSLINPDFYIDVDNLLTPLLSGIADVVDAFGGLKGIIPAVILLINQIFGDKIANGMRGFVENLGIATDYYAKQLRQMQEIAKERAIINNTNQKETASLQAKNLLISEGLKIRQEANKVADTLNSHQKQLLDFDMQRVTQLEKQLELYMGQSKATQELVDRTKESIKTTFISPDALANLRKFKEEYQNPYNINKGGNKPFDIGLQTFFGNIGTTKSAENAFAYVDMLIEQLERLTSKKAGAQQLVEVLKKQLEEIDVGKNSLLNANKIIELTKQHRIYSTSLEENIRQIMNAEDETNKYEAVIEKLREKIREASFDIDTVIKMLKAMGVDTSNVNKLTQYLIKLGFNEEEVRQHVEALTKAYHEQDEAFKNNKYSIQDWADVLTTVGRQLSSTMMIVRSIRNIGEIFSDKDLSNTEKAIRAFSSLAFILPTVGMLLKTVGIQNSVAAIKANAHAVANVILARSFSAAGMTAAEFGAKLKLALPLIGLIAAAIAGVITIVDEAIKAQEEYQQSIRDTAYEAAETASQENEANSELIRSMAERLNTYKETEEGKDELDEATQNLTDAFNLEGNALAELSGQYEDYEKVLNRATEAQNKALGAELTKLETARGLLEQEIISQAKKQGTVFGSTYSASFGVNDIGEENWEQGILSKYLDPKFSEGFSRSFKIKIDIKDAQNLLDVYEQLSEAREYMIDNMSPDEVLNSTTFKGVDEWLNGMQEVIDKYKEYTDQISIIKAQRGELELPDNNIQSITDTQISNVQEYKQWIDEITSGFEKLGKTEEEISSIIDNLIQSSSNPDLSGFRQIYEAIQQIRDLTTDWKVSEDWLIGIFDSDQYDKSILSSLNWAAIIKEDFDEAYNSAKRYSEALNEMSDAQSRLEGAQQALEVFGKGDLKIKDAEKIEEYIDWGNAKEGIIDFTDWINKETWQQQAYLNKLVADSYDQIIESSAETIDHAREEIEKNQAIIDDVSEEELQNAYDTIDAYNDAKKMFEDWQDAVAKGIDFDEDDYDIDWDKIKIDDEQIFDFEGFKNKVRYNIERAVEVGTRDSKILISKVDVAQEGLKQAQEDLDNANFTIEVTAKDRFSYQIDQILHSADDLITVFDAVADGISISTDSMGKSFWSFSTEAVEAINSIYPGFAANAKVLEDGTFTLTDSMYKAFFDSSTGQLAIDAKNKSAMLQNEITMLEEKRDNAKAALKLADNLATGEVEIDNLSNEDKKTILEAYKDACALNNGNILADEVNTLTTSDTNWSNLWSKVSEYSGQGANNMALNVADATGSVLQNLEKIRSAAAKAGEQFSLIASDSFQDLGAIDVSAALASEMGKGHTTIDTSSPDKMFRGIKTLVAGEQIIPPRDDNTIGSYLRPEGIGSALDLEADQRTGKAFQYLFTTAIGQYDEMIGAKKIAQGKLLSAIDNAYDSGKKALDDFNKGNKGGKGGKGSGSEKEPKQEELLGITDEEIEKYHELNRELEYYDYLINQIDEDISNATTIDEKLELEAQKVDLLNKQYELLNKQRKEAYNYIKEGVEDLQTGFGDIFAKGGLTIQFGENDDIINYEELEQFLINQVQNAMTARDAWVANVYNKASAEEQENLESTLKEYDDVVKAAETVLKDFRDSAGDYETNVDTYRDSIEKAKAVVVELTEAERQRYELNLQKLQELEDKFYSTEREDSHLSSRRNLVGNKIEIGGSQERMAELFGEDADLIWAQASNAQETYNQAWENIRAIKDKIVEYWPEAQFDPSTGEITNYDEILRMVDQRAQEATDALNEFYETHDKDNLTEEEEELEAALIADKAAAVGAQKQFQEFASEHGKAMNTMMDAQQEYSDSILETLENAEKAFDVVLEKLEQMEDRLYKVHRALAWDDLKSQLLQDAYDLADSDEKRAEIAQKQLDALNERRQHDIQELGILATNLSELREEGKRDYGAQYDERGNIASVFLPGINTRVGIENTDAIHDYVERLGNELGELTKIPEEARTKEQNSRIEFLATEEAKWNDFLNSWLDLYTGTQDDFISTQEDLSHIPVEMKEKEEELYELQQKKNPEEIEDLETIDDRYHDVNRQIERQEGLLNKISTASDRAFGTAKLKNYADQLGALNKQLSNLNSKFEENSGYLQSDYNALLPFGIPKIDQATGELTNRNELISPSKSAYEDYYNTSYLPAVTALNNKIKAGKEITDEEMKEYEDITNQLNILKTAYEDVTNAVQQYEDSVDTRQDIIDEWQDTIREIEDTKLQELTYKLDVVIQIKDMKRAADEFSKTIAESFGDTLVHGLRSANLSATMAQEEQGLLSNYLQEYNDLKDYVANAVGFIDEDGTFKYATDVQGAMDRLEELQEKVISSGEYLLDWVESLEKLVPDAVDAAAERLAQFTNQLEHNNSILSTIKELYTLQGVTYKTMDGYNRLQKVAQEQYDAQLAQAEISKKYFDGINRELAQAQAELDQVSEGSLEYDMLKANRDALLDQYNEAQEAYLSKAKEAMETAHDIYLQALEKSSYDFSQAISGGVGLDLLQDKYDNYINEEERYLDTVNELYQVNSWNLKLQAAIDDASTSAQKDRLKALKDEIDLRRQGGKLSQYDLDILEAKYNLQMAQMALEDAQNAKNQARLVRDSQGNWNYQFYADDTQVQDAQQKFLDAQNEYYNIAKQQVQDVTSEILQTWQECNDKIKEIYEDESLTVEEREAAIAETRRHYAEIIKGLEEEKNIAIGDMNTVALQSILYMTETGTASIIDMHGNVVPVVQQMSDEVKTIIAKMEEETGIEFDDMTKQAIALLLQMGLDTNTIMNGLRIDSNGHITGMSEDIKTALAGMVSTSAEQENTWSNDFANTLDKMTENTDQFDELLDTYIDSMENNWGDYEDKVQNAADTTGTSVEELDEEVNQLSDSTDRLSEEGLNARDSLLEQIDAAQDASLSYIELAGSIMKTVKALEELSRSWAGVGQDWSVGEGVGDNVLTPPELGMISMGSDGVIRGPDGKPINADDYDVDWSDLMFQAYLRGDTKTGDMLGLIRETSSHWGLPGHEQWDDNPTVKAEALAARKRGEKYQGYEGPFKNNSMTFEEWMHLLGIPGYATGGYTGDFDSGKLAFLHEKELVLNQEDTQNILAAVTAVRSFGPELFSQIEKILDGNVVNAMASLTSRIVAIQQPFDTGVIEQEVKIEASFPSVTDRNEIEEAFNSLVNDAAQYARRRKE